MSYIKEDYLLGNKKLIVGDKLHDLVLENLGRIYIRYGNSYKEFNQIIKSLSGSSTSTSSKVIIETEGLKEATNYKDGSLVYDIQTSTLYLVYEDSFLTLIEYVSTAGSGYVKKTGDVMTGQLAVNTTEAPFIISSQKEVNNLNANYLQGYTAEKFPRKSEAAEITGNWTFKSDTNFEKNVNVDGTLTLTNRDTALKIITGDFITNGSIGSESFSSGYVGNGWRLDALTNTLEIDNLIVRNVLQVYELVVNKISATNGSLWITDSFNVAEVKELNFVDCSTGELGSLFSNEFYVPYILNTTEISEDSEWETKLENSKETNHWTIKLDESKYPTASNLEKTTDTNYSYSRFNYFISISDIRTFKSYLEENNYTVADLAKASVIDKLNESHQVKKIYFYQNNDDNIDSEFDKNLFVVGTGNIQPYNDEYTFTEKAYINLYYKYFGEHDVWTNVYILNPEEGEYPVFKSGDILKCQKYQDCEVKVYTAVVLGIASNGYIIQTDGGNIPQKKDALVRIGSIYEGIRRNSLMLTSSENDSPYEDVLTNINRPDYTVGYYIPKFKTFELDGVTYYLQDDTYQGEGVTKDIPITALDPTTSISDSSNVQTIWESNIPTDNAFYNSAGEEVTINDLYTSIKETPVVNCIDYTQNTTSDKIILVQNISFGSEFVNYKNTYIVNSKAFIKINPQVTNCNNPTYKLYYKYYKDGVIIYKAIDITKETDISSLFEGRYVWCKLQAICNSAILYYQFDVHQVTNEIFQNIKTNSEYSISVQIDLDSSSLLKTCIGTKYLTGHEIIETVNGLYKADFVKNTKVRLGNLDGIYDKLLGQLEGFGLYGSNVYLTGNFLLNNGKSLADIDETITLGVGDTKRIQSKVESLSNELKNTTSQLQDDINQVSNSVDATIGNYISTNKDAIFKLGLDYSMLALGSAGISVINPNVKYNSDGEIDQSTVGDGDEYVSIQGDKTQINSYQNVAFVDSSNNTLNRKMVICTYFHPNLWTYDEDAYVPKINGSQVPFFIGYVDSLPSETEQISASTLKYVSFSSITYTSCTVSGNEYYNFNTFYNNNIQTVYSYSQDVYSGTIYFVPRIVNVALFKDGKLNSNLIDVNNLVLRNLLATETGNYGLDDNGNLTVVDKTKPYVIINGEDGTLSANNGTIKVGSVENDGIEYFVKLDSEYKELQGGNSNESEGWEQATTRITGKTVDEALQLGITELSGNNVTLSSDVIFDINFELNELENIFWPSGDDTVILYKKIQANTSGYINNDVTIYITPNWNFVKPTQYNSSQTYYTDTDTYGDGLIVCKYGEITVNSESEFNTYLEQGRIFEISDRDSYDSVTISIPSFDVYNIGKGTYYLNTFTSDKENKYYYITDFSSNLSYSSEVSASGVESTDITNTVSSNLYNYLCTLDDNNNYVSKITKNLQIFSQKKIGTYNSCSTNSYFVQGQQYTYEYSKLYNDGQRFSLVEKINTKITYNCTISEKLNVDRVETIIGSDGLVIKNLNTRDHFKVHCSKSRCDSEILSSQVGLLVRYKKVLYEVKDYGYPIRIPLISGNITSDGIITHVIPDPYVGSYLLTTKSINNRKTGTYSTTLDNSVKINEWWFQSKHHGFKNLEDYIVIDFDLTDFLYSNFTRYIGYSNINVQVSPCYVNYTNFSPSATEDNSTNSLSLDSNIPRAFVTGCVVSILVHKNVPAQYSIDIIPTYNNG